MGQVGTLAGTDYFYYLNGSLRTIYKYTFGGSLEWSYQDTDLVSESIIGGDHTRLIAVDDLGNVYFMGRKGASDPRSLKVIKVDSAGDLVWESEISATSGYTFSEHRCLAVDANYNVYVGARIDATGATTDGGESSIYLDSSGTEQWREEDPSGSAPVNSYPEKAAFDASGNVYVMMVRAGGNNIWLRSYDSSGTLRFEKGAGFGPATGVSGDIEVYGSRLFAVYADTTNKDVEVYAYSGSDLSTEDWSQIFDYSATTLFGATRLGVDQSGDVFVTYSTIQFGPTDHFGHRIRITGAGTLVYDETDDESAERPLVAPGRPPVFF